MLGSCNVVKFAIHSQRNIPNKVVEVLPSSVFVANKDGMDDKY